MKQAWTKPELYEFILNTGCRISETKNNLREETKEKIGRLAVMLSSQEQGELMKLLVAISGAKKGIEVGVFTGYSALCLAEGLPEDGKLYALDVSEEWTSIGQKYWEEAGVADKIELILAPAIETLDGFIADEEQVETFDFAFIDADKVNYPDYYEKLITLLKPNGFIIVDNVLWGGSVVEDPSTFDEDTAALRKLSDIVREDERVEHVMLPIADGVTIIRKK
uniref:SAM-dependent methyltransferase n=1 Tax=Euplotes crassus TaxID=5936 RepID=A0A7S3KC42_EUPCR|mmetsp:Transcript_17097/g.16777  ORF Transcript_17097/g.16777 Transcript_17097/m.16777 type:complete len:223 (+) Transcript_17097:7-675(+)